MSDQPEVLPAPQEPPQPPPPPHREAFWSYTDLALFIALALPCMLLGLGVVKGTMLLFHLADPTGAVSAVLGQFIFYLFLFLALRMMLAAEYGRPFWRSLGWTNIRLPAVTVIFLGIATAIAIADRGPDDFEAGRGCKDGRKQHCGRPAYAGTARNSAPPCRCRAHKVAGLCCRCRRCAPGP